MLSNVPLSFPQIPCYTVGSVVVKHGGTEAAKRLRRRCTARGKEADRMLDNMDIFSGTQQAELNAGAPDETGFAQIYFAFYPYLGNA